ncbi:hypothetical protein Pmani_019592 [Petrolisthes manimaculis]|uniref:Uncharacterized protein n=1 Tax=Petrolisthes manimaculis TaxID=1843537 RepID=A0AAE1PHD6_9EUCA|nr:hypothetical protein Pmani_019592 [Petrolisthes manimaculis]
MTTTLYCPVPPESTTLHNMSQVWSRSIGRRKAVLFSSVSSIFASFLTVASPNVETYLFFRMIHQALDFGYYMGPIILFTGQTSLYQHLSDSIDTSLHSITTSLQQHLTPATPHSNNTLVTASTPHSTPSHLTPATPHSNNTLVTASTPHSTPSHLTPATPHSSNTSLHSSNTSLQQHLTPTTPHSITPHSTPSHFITS